MLFRSARQKELGSDLDRLRRQRTVMHGRSCELTAELRRSEEDFSTGNAEHAQLRARLAATEAELSGLAAKLKADQATLDRERQKQLELMQQASAAQQRIANLNSQRDAANSAAISTSIRLDQCVSDTVSAQSEVLRRQAAVDAVLGEVATLDGRVREVRDRQQQLIAEQERLQQQLREQREDRSARQSQQAVLEDLERRQEGFGIGVKEILSRAQSSDYAPWNSILGSVAEQDHVTVDEYGPIFVIHQMRNKKTCIDKMI